MKVEGEFEVGSGAVLVGRWVQACFGRELGCGAGVKDGRELGLEVERFYVCVQGLCGIAGVSAEGFDDAQEAVALLDLLSELATSFSHVGA